MDTLSVPQGNFRLARYPELKNRSLRAWDAADVYLLRELYDSGPLHPGIEVLLVNDRFGALSVALADLRPQMMSDSFLAHRGTELNLRENHRPADAVRLLTSLQPPHGPLDLVIIKIPKTLALLEDQLHRIRPRLTADSRIIGGGMVKGIHRSTLQLFERVIGPTETSLARQKARLIYSRFDPDLAPGASPYPGEYRLENSGHRLINHANVFSRERLDIGTRLFLERIPAAPDRQRIVDLGCGNGVVGLIAAERNPAAELIFVDESYMAVASAETNFRNAFGAARQARFLPTNCLDGIAAGSVDLVLNNPPFHQQSAVGDHIARAMFRASMKVLKSGGKLLVVGNRHLGYHFKLKQLFGNCTLVAGNRKFVILRADKKSSR